MTWALIGKLAACAVVWSFGLNLVIDRLLDVRSWKGVGWAMLGGYLMALSAFIALAIINRH